MIPFAAVLAIALQAVPGSETNGEAAEEPAGGQQPSELTLAVSFSVEHRTRYEHLNNQFRAGRSSDDRLLVFRTLAAVELDAGRFRVSTEFQDARTELADAETPLSTSIVNPVDLLQAYVEVPVDNLLAEGSSSVLRGGRVTMDIGSRRLIARDNFTNVSYAFTGVDWQWTGPDDSRLRTFFTFPVQRQVSGDILENRPRFDTESGNVRFWGVHYSPAGLPWGDEGEFYYFGLDESDSPGRRTADRDFHTLGARLHRPAAEASFDYQFESIFQLGRSRMSKSATTDLDHRARYFHIEAGYTFAAPGAPRLKLQYDYASGDKDPTDGQNNRFSGLFGSRSGDFGPSGIYGLVPRTNISSPGAHLSLMPGAGVETFMALRAYWLATVNDAWLVADISSPAGQAQSHIGNQVEFRVRWDVRPGRLRFQAGGAHLFAGDLPASADKSDPTYFYAQTTVSF